MKCNYDFMRHLLMLLLVNLAKSKFNQLYYTAAVFQVIFLSPSYIFQGFITNNGCITLVDFLLMGLYFYRTNVAVSSVQR